MRLYLASVWIVAPDGSQPSPAVWRFPVRDGIEIGEAFRVQAAALAVEKFGDGTRVEIGPVTEARRPLLNV